MSTPSQLYFGKGFFLCFATQILHPSGHSVAKKAGTAWEHWTSQIDDHLKPSTVAKRCTSLKSRKSPALRGFVAGRWALATTFLYPSTKIERLRRTQNRAPGGLFSLEFMLLWEGRFSVTLPPRNHLPTRGPTPPKSRFGGPCPTPAPKPAHRGDTAVTAVAPWLVPLCTLPHAVRFSREVGAGFRPQKAFGRHLRQFASTSEWAKSLRKEIND